MITHLQLNSDLPHGRIARNFLDAVDNMLTWGDRLFRLCPTMIDGDGSQAAQFAEMTARFGFPDNATALAWWNEFQSAWSKVSGDGSVSSVNTALKQLSAKSR